MRQLLHNTSEFIWDEPQASAFQKVKEILTRIPGPVLAYYDPKKPVTLQVDASKYGFGVVLLKYLSHTRLKLWSQAKLTTRK